MYSISFKVKQTLGMECFTCGHCYIPLKFFSVHIIATPTDNATHFLCIISLYQYSLPFVILLWFLNSTDSSNDLKLVDWSWQGDSPDLSLICKLTWWKKRTSPCRLFSALHIHTPQIHTHVYIQIDKWK